MSLKPNRRNLPAVQAFADYADLVREHARDAARWDDDDRVAERRAAHAAFTAVFAVIK